MHSINIVNADCDCCGEERNCAKFNSGSQVVYICEDCLVRAISLLNKKQWHGGVIKNV